MNEGSRAPDYASGPVWAIFDSAAVQRRQLADPLPLHRRSARRLFPQGRHAGRAGAESHGASPSEDAAEISRGDGEAIQRVRRTRARTRTSRSRSCIGSTRRPSMRRRQGFAFSIPTAAFGSTARRKSWTRTAGHPRPLCRRRGQRRRFAAWHRPSLGPRLHRRDERSRRAYGLRAHPMRAGAFIAAIAAAIGLAAPAQAQRVTVVQYVCNIEGAPAQLTAQVQAVVLPACSWMGQGCSRAPCRPAR